MDLEVNFWGTRGSFLKNGPECHEFGGHTSCISLHWEDEVYIIDGGSGLSTLTEYFPPVTVPPEIPYRVHFFFSHLHLDHICGLPSFQPLWEPSFEAHLYCGVAKPYGGLKKALTRFYSPPFFPVSWPDFPCKKYHYDFVVGEDLFPTPACEVKTILLNHPGGGSGFKFMLGGKTIIYLCDTNHENGFFEKFIDFSHGADLLIYDASFDFKKHAQLSHYGHSTWEKGCELAIKSEVKHLALTHHEFSRTDEELRLIEEGAKTLFPETILARCAQRLYV